MQSLLLTQPQGHSEVLRIARSIREQQGVFYAVEFLLGQGLDLHHAIELAVSALPKKAGG
jgi:hypothetical protein